MRNFLTPTESGARGRISEFVKESSLREAETGNVTNDRRQDEFPALKVSMNFNELRTRVARHIAHRFGGTDANAGESSELDVPKLVV